MKPWIKRTLIGLTSVTVLAGGLAACGHRAHYADGPASPERVAEWRGKAVDRVTRKLDLTAEQRQKLMRKGSKIPHIEVIEFDNRMEELIAGATAVVAMGGYNTYCEILSFDKPALVVPRVNPREEQLIRATRAAELGLVQMLSPEKSRQPKALAEVLKALPDLEPPSRTSQAFRLEGLPHISQIVGDLLENRDEARLSLVQG